jgi:hypothetical protein
MVLGIIGVALVAVLSLGYVGYSAMNPHSVTVTQQQQYVKPQSPPATTVTTFATITSEATTTRTVAAANTNGYQLNCGSVVGCDWPYNYDACWGTGKGNSVACDGYLTQDQNGCIELAVPTITNTQPLYNHYTLHNLNSTHPPIGSWVVVKGQLFQGSNSAANGAACPSNYINVSTIQPTNPPASP